MRRFQRSVNIFKTVAKKASDTVHDLWIEIRNMFLPPKPKKFDLKKFAPDVLDQAKEEGSDTIKCYRRINILLEETKEKTDKIEALRRELQKAQKSVEEKLKDCQKLDKLDPQRLREDRSEKRSLYRRYHDKLADFIRQAQECAGISPDERLSEALEEAANQTGLAKKTSREAVDAVTPIVSDALARGERVTLVGFGTFQVIKKKERRGVNPQTRGTIHIPAKKVPKFVAGKGLREAAR